MLKSKIQVTVKLSPCMPERHMRVGKHIHSFSTSTLVGLSSQLHALDSLSNGKECPFGTEWVARWDPVMTFRREKPQPSARSFLDRAANMRPFLTSIVSVTQ